MRHFTGLVTAGFATLTLLAGCAGGAPPSGVAPTDDHQAAPATASPSMAAPSNVPPTPEWDEWCTAEPGVIPPGSALVVADVCVVRAVGASLDTAAEATIREGTVSLAFSPDRQRLAYWRFTDGYAVTLFVADVDGGTELELARDPTGGASDYVSWSPDGRYLAYTDDVGLQAVSVDGREHRQVLAGRASQPKFSPDGLRIAFTDDRGIAVIGVDGSAQQLLGAGRDPTWSPDGLSLAYAADLEYVWHDNIYVIQLLDGPPVRLTAVAPAAEIESPEPAPGDRCTPDGFMLGTQVDSQPAWSPDGQYIAFVRSLSKVENNDSVDVVCIMRADGSDLRRVIDVGSDPRPTWIVGRG